MLNDITYTTFHCTVCNKPYETSIPNTFQYAITCHQCTTEPIAYNKATGVVTSFQLSPNVEDNK